MKIWHDLYNNLYCSKRMRCNVTCLKKFGWSPNATRIKLCTNLFLPFPPFLLLFPAALNSFSIERWRHSNLVQMKKVPFSRFSLSSNRSNDSESFLTLKVRLQEWITTFPFSFNFELVNCPKTMSHSVIDESLNVKADRKRN